MLWPVSIQDIPLTMPPKGRTRAKRPLSTQDSQPKNDKGKKSKQALLESSINSKGSSDSESNKIVTQKVIRYKESTRRSLDHY